MAREDSKKVQSFTSFNAGEYSPSLAGRVDLQSFGSSARLLLNFMSEDTGGIKKFYGTKHVIEVEGRQVLLVPFSNEYEPMAIVFFEESIGVLISDRFLQTNMKPPAGVNFDTIKWQQVNDRLIFVSPTTKPFSIDFYGLNEGEYEFQLKSLEFVEEPYFPIGWDGNYNGSVSTSGNIEDNIQIAMDPTAGQLKIPIPSILAGTSSANMLGYNTGINTLNQSGSLAQFMQIPDATGRLIRVRNGAETVLASGVVSGPIVACNGEGFHYGDHDSDALGTRFVYKDYLMNILRSYDSSVYLDENENVIFKIPSDHQDGDDYFIEVIVPECSFGV